MSTTFYAVFPVSPTVDITGMTKLEIGLSRCGWEFFFFGYETSKFGFPIKISSFGDWKDFILGTPGCLVRNEYGETFSLSEFIAMVNQTRGSIESNGSVESKIKNFNDALYALNEKCLPPKFFIDVDNWVFEKIVF